MTDNNNSNDDFELDPFFSDDSDFENIFEEDKPAKSSAPKPAAKEPAIVNDFNISNEIPKQTIDKQIKKKRTIHDFEPDMDALLMTAQSSMIIEGMDYLNENKFSADSLPIYLEALKGLDLYTKILNRNPDNYRKLKVLIDSDLDCQQVEKIAFDLFKDARGIKPETDKEKLESFEAFKKLFKNAVNKASISKSMKLLRKYYLLSGGLDADKIHESVNNGDLETRKDINNFNQNLKIALEMIKKGNSEIIKGLKGKDLNIFITKASELLGCYYKYQDNIKVSDYYYRIYNIYKKYLII